jgi:hypothetical protein
MAVYRWKKKPGTGVDIRRDPSTGRKVWYEAEMTIICEPSYLSGAEDKWQRLEEVVVGPNGVEFINPVNEPGKEKDMEIDSGTPNVIGEMDDEAIHAVLDSENVIMGSPDKADDVATRKRVRTAKPALVMKHRSRGVWDVINTATGKRINTNGLTKEEAKSLCGSSEIDTNDSSK